jgi:glyoxylase-like metal-dependent hydrolase (beta-lactamase superfamily II)
MPMRMYALSLVVDGGGSPLAAKNAIQLIRSVTPKPVAVLITTHWHGDHNLGNQVYRTTFPALRIVIGSYPREWIATLNELSKLPYELLVPGHGDVQRSAVPTTTGSNADADSRAGRRLCRQGYGSGGDDESA